MNRRGFLAALVAAVAAPFVRLRPAPAQSEDYGMSIRLVRSYNVDGAYVTRLDCLYGVAPVYPEVVALVSE